MSAKLFFSCKSDKAKTLVIEPKLKYEIPDTLKWSERIALSIMKRNPEALDIDHISEPKWEYKVGLVLKAYERLYEFTKTKLIIIISRCLLIP